MEEKTFAVTLTLKEAGEQRPYASAAELHRFLTDLFRQNQPNFCLEAVAIEVTESESAAESTGA